jgi:hypothetical protein
MDFKRLFIFRITADGIRADTASRIARNHTLTSDCGPEDQRPDSVIGQSLSVIRQIETNGNARSPLPQSGIMHPAIQ